MTDINLVRIKRETALITIEGTAPMIVNRWSEKAKRMMLDKQQGKKNPREHRDPKQDFLNSMYRFAGADRDVTSPLDSHGAPVMAFKSATVKGGARAFGKSVKMTELRQSLVFLPDGIDTPDGLQLTRLVIDSEPRMREDMVRVGMGTADIRFRPEFARWGIKVQLQFNRRAVSQEQVVNLLNLGGFSVGVCEWRPEKDGDKGRFTVVSKFSWEE
jgi:hypothetical protein